MLKLSNMATAAFLGSLLNIGGCAAPAPQYEPLSGPGSSYNPDTERSVRIQDNPSGGFDFVSTRTPDEKTPFFWMRKDIPEKCFVAVEAWREGEIEDSDIYQECFEPSGPEVLPPAT